MLLSANERYTLLNVLANHSGNNRVVFKVFKVIEKLELDKKEKKQAGVVYQGNGLEFATQQFDAEINLSEEDIEIIKEAVGRTNILLPNKNTIELLKKLGIEE